MSDTDRTSWWTPAGRSLLDMNIMIESGPHSVFFRSRETIKAMHDEQKRLHKSVNALYLITGLLAFFILLGGPAHDAKISAFGIEAPLGALPQQVLAVFMAGIFGFYATQWMSFMLLHLAIAKALAMERANSWQFLAAPFDASMLWSTIIGPKMTGYGSPRRVHVLSVLILLVSGGTVILHAVVVAAAAGVAAWRAWAAGGWFSIVLGTGATVIVTTTILALLAAIMWRVPYRWPEDAPLPSDEGAE